MSDANANGAQDFDPVYDDRSFVGHPKGLAILFLTEMWERFSYYGMRALLIFYLTQHFLFSDQRSAIIYGAYTALVYVMPVLGGMLADRYLGSQKAVVFGGILLVLGHGAMAIEGNKADQFLEYNGERITVITDEVTVTDADGEEDEKNITSLQRDDVKIPFSFNENGITIERSAELGLPAAIATEDFKVVEERNPFYLNIFYLALALIISGVGFLKANISTIVGDLYREKDPRRDSGFTIFYMGINLGAASASILCGWLGQSYGWAYGFGLAGIGMLAGLIIFLRYQHWLGGRAEPPNPEQLKESIFGPLNREWLVYLGGILMVVVSFFLIKNEAVVGHLLNNFGLFMVGLVLFISFFVYEDDRPLSAKPIRFGLFVITFLVLAIVVVAGTFGVSVPNFSLPQTGQSTLDSITGNGWGFTGLLLILASVAAAIITTPSVDRDRMLVVSVLILLQIPFWALFEQAGSSLNLLTDRVVDRHILGWEIPASAFQSLNATYIVLLGPLFAWLWITLSKKGLEPPTPVKFALALVQVGLGYLVLVYGLGVGEASAKAALIWIFLIYLLHTTGELCLSPVGLSAVTKLSVPKVVGMMMGCWFLASGFGNFVSGQIAAATGSQTIGGEIVDYAATKAKYMEVYTNIAWVAIAIGIVVLIVSPILTRGMHRNK